MYIVLVCNVAKKCIVSHPWQGKHPAICSHLIQDVTTVLPRLFATLYTSHIANKSLSPDFPP